VPHRHRRQVRLMRWHLQLENAPWPALHFSMAHMLCRLRVYLIDVLCLHDCIHFVIFLSLFFFEK
jgi:hypothetical protein